MLLADALVWPEFKTESFYQLLQIILFTFALGFFISLWKKRNKKREDSWRKVLRFAYSRHLNSGEVNLLEDFSITVGFLILKQ